MHYWCIVSFISDLVIARQELQREEYLEDIRDRVDHLGAVHRYAEEHPEDPIVRTDYGGPSRRRRRSAPWSTEQLNERAQDKLDSTRLGAVQNEHGGTAMKIMDKLSELKVALLGILT